MTPTDKFLEQQRWFVTTTLLPLVAGRQMPTKDAKDALASIERLVAMVELARGRLQGFAESSLYEVEANWAVGVLRELDRIAGGGK